MITAALLIDDVVATVVARYRARPAEQERDLLYVDDPCTSVYTRVYTLYIYIVLLRLITRIYITRDGVRYTRTAAERDTCRPANTIMPISSSSYVV